MMHLIHLVLASITVDTNAVNVPKGTLTSTNLTNAKNLVFGISGAIAVLIITVAGLQYGLSQGNPQKAARAKDTIIYALVGLVIIILGYAIVGFVVNNVS